MEGRKPRLGESNLGAMAGLVTAAVGGLFAPGLARAIFHGSPAEIISTPILGLICWVISGPIGWLLGGQIGFRIGQRLNSHKMEAVTGGLAGLIPVVFVFAWAWHKTNT